MQKLFDIGLPKWPALVVTGNNVTKDQAKEILIRTDDITYISTNDKTFAREIYGVLLDRKIPSNKCHLALYDCFDGEDGKIDWKAAEMAADSIKSKYQLITLDYLQNSQIASCFIGGPHGWCDWDGTIGTHSYNIGKWPSVDEVYAEWESIAKAFPFLELSCQLFDGESCEDDTKPVIQFDIKDGKVTMSVPTEALTIPESSMFSVISDSTKERGCSVEQFKDAISYVKRKHMMTRVKQNRSKRTALISYDRSTRGNDA